MPLKIRFILRTMIIIALTLAATHYLYAHGWKAPNEAAERKNPIPKGQASLDRGKALYSQFCAACHGLGGKGDGPIANSIDPRPPNLFERAGQHSDGDVAWKIAEGRGQMPAFGKQLSEAQIWDLTNYIQGLKTAK